MNYAEGQRYGLDPAYVNFLGHLTYVMAINDSNSVDLFTDDYKYSHFIIVDCTIYHLYVNFYIVILCLIIWFAIKICSVQGKVSFSLASWYEQIL